MSIAYGITAVIKSNFNRQTVKSIVKDISSLGGTYFKYAYAPKVTAFPVSGQEAIELILEGYAEGEPDFHAICILIEGKKVAMSFKGLDDEWLRVKMWDIHDFTRHYAYVGEKVDVTKSGLIFLNILKDYVICEFEIIGD